MNNNLKSGLKLESRIIQEEKLNVIIINELKEIVQTDNLSKMELEIVNYLINAASIKPKQVS